jgi:hypothetical protein
MCKTQIIEIDDPRLANLRHAAMGGQHGELVSSTR